MPLDRKHVDIEQVEDRARWRVQSMGHVEALGDGWVQHPLLEASPPPNPRYTDPDRTHTHSHLKEAGFTQRSWIGFMATPSATSSPSR